MLIVYVHLRVHGLPRDVLEEDAFLDRLWGDLPDASVSGGAGAPVGITVSQFGLSDRRAALRQTKRLRDALGCNRLAGGDRGDRRARPRGLRDDLSVRVGAVRWHARRALHRG